MCWVTCLAKLVSHLIWANVRLPYKVHSYFRGHNDLVWKVIMKIICFLTIWVAYVTKLAYLVSFELLFGQHMCRASHIPLQYQSQSKSRRLNSTSSANGLHMPYSKTYLELCKNWYHCHLYTEKFSKYNTVLGKCEAKGILMGSNAAIMSVDFDYEVSPYGK